MSEPEPPGVPGEAPPANENITIIVGRVGDAPELKVLLGWPAGSPTEGRTRLYWSLALEHHIEFRTEDIVHSEALPDPEGGATKRARVWLPKAATVWSSDGGTFGAEDVPDDVSAPDDADLLRGLGSDITNYEIQAQVRAVKATKCPCGRRSYL